MILEIYVIWLSFYASLTLPYSFFTKQAKSSFKNVDQTMTRPLFKIPVWFSNAPTTKSLPTVCRVLHGPAFALISEGSLPGPFNSSSTGLCKVPSWGEHSPTLRAWQLLLMANMLFSQILTDPFPLFRSQLKCHLLLETLPWAPHLLCVHSPSHQQSFSVSLPCSFFSLTKITVLFT